MSPRGLPRRDWPLVAAGAVLFVLAFPPFHLFLPAFICLVPAVWLIRRGEDDPRPVRRHLLQGFWFGLLGHGLVLYWIAVALWHFTPLSGLGYAATVAILAVYGALVFAGTGWVVRRTGASVVLVFPVLWTAAEWVVGHQGDIRFPWLGLGTSLTGYPLIVQIADVVGARGVTLLLAVANAALAVAWTRRAARGAWRGPVVVGVGVLLATAYGAWRVRTLPVRPVGEIALVQPNISFGIKWEKADSVFGHLVGVSRRAVAATAPDMVIWPEAAVPGYFFQRPRWEEVIALHAREAGAPVLAGGLDYERYGPEREDYDYWNAAFLFSAGGERSPEAYHKRYLVPITERVPFVNPRWFDLEFFGGFSVGERLPVYETPIGRFGVLICYESTFESLARRYRREGADFLVNITNDAWFGRSSAPYQHFAHLAMRAIENRVGIARAANTGISGYVDPLGRAYGLTGLFAETFVADTLRTSDARTLYERLGDWVGLLSLVAAGALLVRARLHRP